MPELHELDTIDSRIAESPEILGRTCAGCARDLEFKFFDRDSSYRDGYKPLCSSCESSPRLSLEEHTARLKEANLNHGAVKRQRVEDQELYKAPGRAGQSLHHSVFLNRLRKLAPSIFVTEGRIEGDLVLYRIYPCPQPNLGGMDFLYLGYCPTGLLQEFSEYEFSDKDVLVREKVRGWRTVLLRCILTGVISQDDASDEFGFPECPAGEVYRKKLYNHRNRL